MTEKKLLEHPGTNPLGDRGGSSRDKAVHDDRDIERGSRKTNSRHRRNFKTAERREHRRAIVERAPMTVQRADDHFGLAADARIVETGSPANHRTRRDKPDRGEDRSGCSAVRDSHLADPDQTCAISSEIARSFNSNL